MASPVRPVFLDLRKIHLPPNALVSILHRITGVVLILSIPLVLWLLGRSLAGPEGFAQAASVIRHPLGSLLLLGWLWLLMHHFFAGIRFLLADLGFAEDREQARSSAWTALIAGIVAALLLWVLLP